jgi:hypothetical protein
MIDERGYLIDRYGYSADNPRWRDINDSWVYVGKGGLHAYVKVIDGQIMPDIQVLKYREPNDQDLHEWIEKLKARLT